MAGDRPLIEDERFREKVAAVEVELKALEMTQMRVAAPRTATRKDNCPTRSRRSSRSRAARSSRRRPQLLLEVAGPLALPYQPDDDESSAPTSRRSASTGRRPAAPALLQLPQGVDLRRLQRDPAQHHRQGRAGVLRRRSRLWATSCDAEAHSELAFWSGPLSPPDKKRVRNGFRSQRRAAAAQGQRRPPARRHATAISRRASAT